MHVARFGGEFLLQENGQIDFPYEADALRIFALGRGQVLFLGDAPHLGLEESAHGKQRIAQLFLRELAQKVALVLVGVGAGQQLAAHGAVGVRLLGLAAVVTRGHVVGAELEGFVQEDVELDFAVAQHVGIGRAAAFVFGEHVVDHPRAVLGREVDHVQRDVQPLGHQLGEDAVVVPRAVALQGARRVVPVDHEKTDDFVPLLLEKPRGHRRVDAARESYHHACHVSPVPGVRRGGSCGCSGPRSRCVR